eukprot:RCo041916
MKFQGLHLVSLELVAALLLGTTVAAHPTSVGRLTCYSDQRTCDDFCKFSTHFGCISFVRDGRTNYCCQDLNLPSAQVLETAHAVQAGDSEHCYNPTVSFEACQKACQNMHGDHCRYLRIFHQDMLCCHVSGAGRADQGQLAGAPQAEPVRAAVARVEVELPAEQCSTLTDDKLRAVIGAEVTVTLSCPTVVLSCQGAPAEAEKLCGALRERLLTALSSPAIDAVLSMATALEQSPGN